MTMGRCRHGEFILRDGCHQCITERLAGELKAKLEAEEIAKPKKQLVKVKYYSETTGELSGREYTYYSEESLKVGDIIIVPVGDTTGKAKVTTIDVPESEIEAFRDKVKIIPVGSVMKPTLKTGKEIAEKMPVIDDPIITDALAILEPEVEPEEKQTTALITIAPDTDERVVALYNEGIRLRDYALARVIKTDADIKDATNDISIISKLTKALEERRQEYVKPINGHLKAINDSFKVFTEPFLKADRITRDKLLEYRAEQERIRKEQERINELRFEAAKAEMTLKGELTESVELIEIQSEQPNHYRAEVGMAGIAKIRKWEVEDLSKVPLDYLMIDATKVGKVVRAGVPSIAGIRIWVEDSLRITTAK